VVWKLKLLVARRTLICARTAEVHMVRWSDQRKRALLWKDTRKRAYFSRRHYGRLHRKIFPSPLLAAGEGAVTTRMRKDQGD
jgi:hypothetical protein